MMIVFDIPNPKPKLYLLMQSQFLFKKFNR